MRTLETYTTAQAAELLHMRPDSITRKIRQGEIRAVKIGKQYLIPREALERLLEPQAPQG